MAFQKSTFVFFLIFAIACKEVATWTIDLPEVRRFLFEKHEKYKKESKNEYQDYVINKDQEFYSNIQGNSKHNSEHDYEHDHDKDDENYADEYGYHNYMEKKVSCFISKQVLKEVFSTYKVLLLLLAANWI